MHAAKPRKPISVILFISILLLFFNTVHAGQNIRSVKDAGWSGYVVSSNNNSVTSVSGEWTVQQALKSPYGTASAQWVGIGGNVSKSALFQIGTSSCYSESWSSQPFCNNATGASYEAWTMFIKPNWLPGIEQWAPFDEISIHPGDKIKASINFNESCNCWDAMISDNGTVRRSNTGGLAGWPLQNNSAEWIDERPKTTSNTSIDFTNFITAYFRNSTAKINGQSGDISSFNASSRYIFDGYGNDTNTSLLSGTDFDVLNFRVSNITHSPDLSISMHDQKFFLSSYLNGGTGEYDSEWLIRSPNDATFHIINKTNNFNVSNDSNCQNTVKVYGFVISCFQINANTPAGTYSFELQVHSIGGPANETVNSLPVNITVDPSTSIILYNNQPSPTPVPFQQLIAIDSAEYPTINANWSNVEFTINAPYANGGTPLKAWVESGAANTSTSTHVWVRLDQSIPARHHTPQLPLA
jgi:hypothetical protein